MHAPVSALPQRPEVFHHEVFRSVAEPADLRVVRGQRIHAGEYDPQKFDVLGAMKIKRQNTRSINKSVEWLGRTA